MERNIILAIAIAMSIIYGGHAAVFTVKNNCPFTIWPATITGGGGGPITGFELAPQALNTFNVAAPWTGRIWARFQCATTNGLFSCRSGDCGSGQITCNEAGGTPPVSLIEFSLAGSDRKDFYDISLVDGFNLPVSIQPDNNCGSTACPADINNGCPNELAVRDPNGGTIGCKSACLAFQEPQYCCNGAYSTPDKCLPSNYSQFFKRQCPQAYCYAYDDVSSTFTCPTGGNYNITFCPTTSNRQHVTFCPTTRTRPQIRCC